MSTSQKSKVSMLITLLVLALTTFQGLIPTLPLKSTVLISAVTLFLVSATTAWKQYLSDEISNAALKPTLVVAILATLTGLSDLLNVFHFSGTTGQWIRFGFTFIAAFINLASKILWPTAETKSMI